jgi:hypothetical protein
MAMEIQYVKPGVYPQNEGAIIKSAHITNQDVEPSLQAQHRLRAFRFPLEYNFGEVQ